MSVYFADVQLATTRQERDLSRVFITSFASSSSALRCYSSCSGSILPFPVSSVVSKFHGCVGRAVPVSRDVMKQCD